jgi:hypothetical protein
MQAISCESRVQSPCRRPVEVLARQGMQRETICPSRYSIPVFFCAALQVTLMMHIFFYLQLDGFDSEPYHGGGSIGKGMHSKNGDGFTLEIG